MDEVFLTINSHLVLEFATFHILYAARELKQWGQPAARQGGPLAARETVCLH